MPVRWRPARAREGRGSWRDYRDLIVRAHSGPVYADGVHPFLQPVTRTKMARKALGANPLLIPHQSFVLDPDGTAARGTLHAILGTGRPTMCCYTR